MQAIHGKARRVLDQNLCRIGKNGCMCLDANLFAIHLQCARSCCRCCFCCLFFFCPFCFCWGEVPGREPQSSFLEAEGRGFQNDHLTR